MKTVIATTTGFHLRRLAVEFNAVGQDVSYFSYMPKFRMRSDGLDFGAAHSLFASLLPRSAFALMRGNPWQMQSVESMLIKTDDFLAKHLPPSDHFIGLSSMAVRSAARARDLGATVLIDRGSRHVLSQNALIVEGGGQPLSQRYIERELASYEQADVVTVLSQHAAESFVEQGFDRDRLFVCPLGVDLKRFTPSSRPSGPVKLLFVGGWSYQKGVDLLADAVKSRPEWYLTHVGMGAGIKFPSDCSRITRVGHCNHEQLAEIMTQHHVLVLPSRQDGFGMVLLEALAAGLPVVASRMTGASDIRAAMDNPEWVEVVQPNSAEDLLRGLDSMVEKEARTPVDELRERLSEKDKCFFSWRGYANRYQEFLIGRSQARNTVSHEH